MPREIKLGSLQNIFGVERDRSRVPCMLARRSSTELSKLWGNLAGEAGRLRYLEKLLNAKMANLPHLMIAAGL